MKKMGAAANKYWVAFAKTGDPDSAGGPKWPKYTAGQDMILDFTESGPVAEADPWKDRLDLISGVASSGH